MVWLGRGPELTTTTRVLPSIKAAQNTDAPEGVQPEPDCDGNDSASSPHRQRPNHPVTATSQTADNYTFQPKRPVWKGHRQS